MTIATWEEKASVPWTDQSMFELKNIEEPPPIPSILNPTCLEKPLHLCKSLEWRMIIQKLTRFSGVPSMLCVEILDSHVWKNTVICSGQKHLLASAPDKPGQNLQ